MPELSERLIKRIEQKFDSGENHFIARGMLASVALGLAGAEVRDDTILDSYEYIVDFLAQHNAEGEVYANREDHGNGAQDSNDYVRVTSRDGVETGAERHPTHGVVVQRRATTDKI